MQDPRKYHMMIHLKLGLGVEISAKTANKIIIYDPFSTPLVSPPTGLPDLVSYTELDACPKGTHTTECHSQYTCLKGQPLVWERDYTRLG